MVNYQPSDSELSSFCEAMLGMYAIGRSLQPDLIIFPLRGAYPFFSCYQTIVALEKASMPQVLLSPIGTCMDKSVRKERGMTKPEKIDILKSSLDEFLADSADFKTILLIDEVMMGGTILEHFSIIKKYLNLNSLCCNLKVCAIEDGKRQQRGEYRNKARKFGFHQLRVDNLFVMDREQFLPLVIKGSYFRLFTDKEKLEKITTRLTEMYST